VVKTTKTVNDKIVTILFADDTSIIIKILNSKDFQSYMVTAVTNVKCESLCVRLYILILVFFWICMLKWLQLDSIHFLIEKQAIVHSCSSALICQFPILSKRLTPILMRSVCLNCKIHLCIILL